MADFAIGISKTAVEALVNKIQSAIKEEAEQWQIVERDLVFITDEFEMMQSFLNSARRERFRNIVVRTWVRQVRDLSYDVEDCIEFVLHLDTEKQSWWLRLLPSCRCGKKKVAPLPQDQAVIEIKQLKARVEDVSKRRIRYSLITGDSADSESLKPQPQFESGSAIGAPGFDILVEAKDTMAMPGGSVDLTELVTHVSKGLQVMSMWGTGDHLGTISIIRRMYDDSRIYKDFRCRAWVKVMHPINPHEFVRSLVVQFYANFGQQQGGTVGIDDAGLSWTTASAQHIFKEFMTQIHTHRYLIILEDLSTMVDWDAIRPYLPDNKKGSRIVVSTPHHEMASLCTGKPHRISELQWFSPDKPICVFYNEVIAPAQGSIDGVLLSKERVDRLLDQNYLVGRAWEAEKLFNLINNRPYTDKPHVISIWGIPGSGRTTFAASVLYRCVYEKKHHFDWWMMVHMPQPYHLMAFCCRLLYSVRTAGLQLKAENLIEQCRELLHEYRCLVIIDGMQSKEDWDLIKANLLSAKSESCIVITATEEGVARHCAVTDDLMCSIKNLQAKAALDLFRQAFSNNKKSMVLDHADVEAILSKSGGLPKVIVALGRYLASQDDEDTRKSQCRRLKANFVQELETGTEFISLRGVLTWIRSYLWSCPPVLMTCMLYLLIFPQGETFHWRRLVRRWIAEGYVKGTESNSLEELARGLFRTLASKGMIQQATPTPREVQYEVNGLLQEFIISRPMEDKIFFPLEVSILDKDHRSLTIEGVGQHLAVWRGWERNRTVYDSLDFQRLRSLTVFGRWEEFFISERMKVLRVLDLQGASDVQSTDLGRMVQFLPRLKFLSLRGSKDITDLPDSFGDLRQLQTLDVRYTSISKLPKSIVKLRKLQYIRAGAQAPSPWTGTSSSGPPQQRRRCAFLCKLCGHNPRNHGIEVPRGVDKLTALHTLGIIDASAPGGTAILRELRKLTQLHKLGVSGIKRDNVDKLNHLTSFSHLRSLSLHLQKDSRAVGAQDIKLPTGLRSLKLHGHVENMPQSIKDLGDLMKLSLDKITLKREDIEVLGKLEKLHTLRLRVRKLDKPQFCARPDGADQTSSKLFLGLQVLHVACASSLHVTFGEGAMEKLELLALHLFQQQQTLQLPGLYHLISLKKLSLRGSYDDRLKEDLQQQLDAHKNKPVLDLEK